MRILKYKNFNIKEDANATAGNTSGMGSVTAPTIGGDGATGSNFNYNGDGNPTGTGTKGSGDLPAYDIGNKFDTNILKKNKKKKRNTKKNKKIKKENMYVTSWKDWLKI